MTRTTNARLAGATFLLYIATAAGASLLFSRAARGEGIAAQLASIAKHTTLVRLSILLVLLTFVVAVSLAVALYGLTRDEDRDLAVLALSCRVAESALGAFPVGVVGMLWLATDGAVTGADPAVVNALAALLLKVGAWKTLVGATCFAVGSTLFSYLFLRARSIPAPLAWLGVAGSLLLVVGLPLRLAGLLGGPAVYLMWIPVAVFEVTLAVWLLTKGVAAR